MPKPLATESRAAVRRKHTNPTKAKGRFVKTPKGYVLVREGMHFIEPNEIDNVSPNDSITFVAVNDRVRILVTKNENPKYKILNSEDIAAFIKGLPVETVAPIGRKGRIIRGIGSTLDMYPDVDYGEFIPKQNTAARVRGYFENTGKHLYRAMRKVAAENE